MPDLTREEVEAAKARAEAAMPTEEWASGRFHAESSGPHEKGRYWVLADDGDAIAEVHGHLAFGIDVEALASFYAAAHVDVPALCDLALRQMEEIGQHDDLEDAITTIAEALNLLNRIEGDEPPGEVIAQEIRLLTADLAAARAAIERVEALADEIESRANHYDGQNVRVDLRKMAAGVRAALRGQEGAKDA